MRSGMLETGFGDLMALRNLRGDLDEWEKWKF
jgi:hypothetical protein